MVSTHHVSGAVLSTVRGQPCLSPHQAASWSAPGKAWSHRERRAGQRPRVPCHCPGAAALQEEEMEAWPQHDLGGSQHGAGRGLRLPGLTAHPLPPILMTKLIKHPSPRPNRAGGGRIREENWWRAGQAAGEEERRWHLSGHEASEDKSSKGRDAVADGGQETSF